MDKLATKLREAQLYAHACHNTVSGSNFLELHEFFEELYGAYESAYDSVVERIIGLGDEKLDLPTVNIEAAKAAAEWPTKNIDMIPSLQALEEDIRGVIEEYSNEKSKSAGTKNLVAQIADDSEVRSYKLKQLIK